VKFNHILMTLREAFGVNKRIVHFPHGVACGLARLFELAGKLFRFTPLVTTDIIEGMSRSVYFYDISKARRDGYVPGITLEQGIKITTDWMKKA
jgi:nucleoside-diphosphate-sugar epimerase